MGSVAWDIFCDRATLLFTGEWGVLDLCSDIARSDDRVSGRCRGHGNWYQGYIEDGEKQSRSLLELDL